jgi:hypothetical protein
MDTKKNEQELTRECFIELISFISVGYFCVSTETRFILQLQKDPLPADFKPEEKNIEAYENHLIFSEYWHAKSLEIACMFLPSDCPLLSHIMLSYQKHHAPT